MEIQSPEEAQAYIESKNIKIVPAKLYNIYACGCIIKNKNDPHRAIKFKRANNSYTTKARCCPFHDQKLLGKFKFCNCGAIYFSKRIHESRGCIKCKRQSAQLYYRQTKGKKNFKKKNVAKRDISRWDCLYRDICLVKYDGYQTVPCKDCKKYIQDPDIETKLLNDLMHNKKFHELTEHIFGW